jgi:hypothetical protein
MPQNPGRFPSFPGLAALACAWLLLPAMAAAQGGWPNLNVRGVALRAPGHGDLRDTVLANYTNSSNTVSLVWDRDSASEARVDFGGYAVYRNFGPDTAGMTLLRRYVKRPSEKFGNGIPNPDNGQSSRLWTWLDSPRRDDGGNLLPYRPYAGLFCDPDSILAFNRQLVQIGTDPGGAAIFDTAYVRETLSGPVNGFKYYYAVTIVDTTVDGNDLTPRTAGLVGPLVPTTAPVANNLDVVKVVPNPYTFHADWDVNKKGKVRFVDLPTQVTIDIYSATADHVRTLQHNNPIDSGEDWDLQNGQGMDVLSGIYIFHLQTPDGRERVGRFTVIR